MRRWDTTVLCVALVAVGIGLVASTVLAGLGSALASPLSSVALWVAMSGAVGFAFARARPNGLLRFRAIDLLWGVGFGVCLRVLQGWMSGSDARSFPSALAIDGILPAEWWSATATSAGLVAPLVEEFFFRAVILVTVYALLRRSAGSLAAAVTSVLVSAGGFVLLHAAFSVVGLPDGIQLFTFGAVCSALVLLTGRIWGAVVIHISYNASFLLLVVLGSLLR